MSDAVVFVTQQSAVLTVPAGSSEESLSRRVHKSALWSAASTLILKLANIAIMAVVARTLTPHDFGVFAVALTVHTVVSSVAELGLTACLMRGDIDPDELAPTVAMMSLLSSLALATVMVLFARPIAAALGSASAAGPLRVMALAVLLVGVFAVPTAELLREFRQDRQFIATIVGFIPSNVLLIVLATGGSGAMSFAWSRVLGQLLTGLAITCMVPRWYWPRFARRHVRFLLSFGIPLAGANLLNFILLNADYALVGRLMGAVELGIYMLAFNIASWSTSLLSAMINGIAMPAFSRIKHDSHRLQRGLSRSTQAIALIALPICSLTLTLAHPLVVTVYGSRWDAAAPVLAILALYGALSVFCLLIANVLSGMGHTVGLFVVQVAWLAALVPLMNVGVRYDGIVGAAYAHIVVVILVAVPAYLIMLKRASSVRLLPLVSAVAPALIGSVVCGVASYGATTLVGSMAGQLLLGGAVGGVAYLMLTLPTLLPLARTVLRLPPSVLRAAERYCALLSRYVPVYQSAPTRTHGRHRAIS